MTGRALALSFFLLTTGLVAQRPSTPKFVPLSGEPWSGEQITVESEDLLRMRRIDGSSRTIAVDELEALELGGDAMLPSAGPGHVWLRSGVEFGARPIGGADAAVELELGFPTPARVALVHIQALRIEPAEAAGDYDGFTRAQADPPTTDDLLFAWNRQSGKLTRLSVRVLGFDATGVRVDYRGERTVPLDQVHGIVFGRENGIAPAAPKLPSVVIEAGSPITALPGKLIAWSPSAVTLRLAEGIELAVSPDSIHRIEVRSSRVLRLSARQAAEMTQTAAMDRLRPVLENRAPGGEGLALGEQKFARGLCLIPRTRISWALEPNAFDAFDATIGIDARSTGPADAVFRIALDDRLVLEREHVRAGTSEAIRIPLGAARKLTIEVDFGANLDLGDHCVFADPRLMKL